jgi:hypothetical protein
MNSLVLRQGEIMGSEREQLMAFKSSGADTNFQQRDKLAAFAAGDSLEREFTVQLFTQATGMKTEGRIP